MFRGAFTVNSLSSSRLVVKVSKSQKHFFLKLHTPKNERNIRQILPYEARAEFCLIFCSCFGQWTFKKNCFRDLLTFSMTELKVLVILMSSFHCKYLMQTWFFSSKKIQFSLRKIIWRSIDFGTYLKSSLYKFILFIANILCKPVSIPLFSSKKIRFPLEIVITCYWIWRRRKKSYFHNIQYFSWIERIFIFVDILQCCWWYDDPEYLISSKRKVKSNRL